MNSNSPDLNIDAAMATDPEPRIPPLPTEDWGDEVHELMDIFAKGTTSNVVKTFARHPALAQPFMLFNRYLLRDASLPARLRQIAILRLAWTRRSPYLWAAHLRASAKIGMSAEDFAAAKQGAHSPHWSATERAVLVAVDEIRDVGQLQDASWEDLSAHLDQRQIMDFLFTVGTYMLVGMAMNVMRVQREPDTLELAEKFGSPS